MPATIIGENYDGINALYKNAGDWTSASVDFVTRFSIGSGESNKVTYSSSGSVNVLTFQSGAGFGAAGFLPGDNVTLSFLYYIGNNSVPFVWNATVDYISGTQMFLTGPLPSNPGTLIWPTSGFISGLAIVADKLPDAIEFEFNLTPNGSTILNSVLDNQLQRFEITNFQAIGVGNPTPMTQLTDKSGGYFKDVNLIYLGAPGNQTRDFRITYKFLQWGIIKDGEEPPTYYDAADHLAPIVKIRALAQYGNPNGILDDTSENTEGNTGYFDENYNGGTNNYESISTDWFDGLGNPIDGLNYSGPSTFIAIIEAPNQSNPQSTYKIGLAFRPIDASVYQTKITDAGENLMINAPELDFIADGVTIPGPFTGEQNDQGAQWDFENLTFELTGATELTVTGQVTPNAAAAAYFVNFPDGERKTTLWISLGNYNLNAIQDDRVSLRIFDQDNIDAPIIGVQIPNVVNEILLDHAQINITAPEPQTTTEDDVLYTSDLRLIDGVQYEGMRTRISVFNTATEEEFTLENQFFSFVNVPFIGGQFQPNIIQPRNFNLPPGTDRNEISIVRKQNIDVPGLYGIQVRYGFLNDWRYWLEQSNADNDFFDALESFNGKNKNWQRYYLPLDWVLRISYYTIVAGVQDFNNFQFGIRPYEDESCTTTITNTILSSGTQVNDYVNNEIHQSTVRIIWNAGSYDYSSLWAEVTIENFENGNRWVISSVLPQGNIAANPLKPIAGQTQLLVTPIAANELKLDFLVDTNVVDAAKVCLSYRIFSELGIPEGAKMMAPTDQLKYTTYGEIKIKA